ncbi:MULTISPECIES: hypothetical protein [Nocardia]|uniref:Uncharacterized protein n=3 Tax=Nocardia farcinica TaxID=37329 RepID=Q5YN61_NOCFA|nr:MULTISPECIES: hypothetical protein [Nocardia]AXK87242.1 hypothetical protein DXT66_17860 [Nocardia farcinica]MBA4858581.1 hypothetical protein [Nocardia farcinica]MBC9819206.1 hypothetical protein [Nocardia farcinica]MBF6069045.1 hypothetical protein [Nocardia farcinica]MBF6186638.1 hypothetical protein [Nocardia farcinica]
MRRQDLDDAVVLTSTGPLLPPPLHMEVAGTDRMLLRQCGRAILLGRIDGDRTGVELFRRVGYRSPLPPLDPAETGTEQQWLSGFADALSAADNGPLHPGRWLLEYRSTLTHGTWHGEFIRDWPGGYLAWRRGCTAIIPLRPLTDPDAPELAAARRRARAGTLAPVLLWEVSGFDGWVILDGHDRAVAALAEGHEPASIVLARGWSMQKQTDAILGAIDHQRRVLAGLRDERERRDVTARMSAGMARFAYGHERTMAWPVPGGLPGWTAALLDYRGDQYAARRNGSADGSEPRRE